LQTGGLFANKSAEVKKMNRFSSSCGNCFFSIRNGTYTRLPPPSPQESSKALRGFQRAGLAGQAIFQDEHAFEGTPGALPETFRISAMVQVDWTCYHEKARLPE
jgi:hypothetical protein